MPRKARIDAPGALHHVVVRAIERGKIFGSDYDRMNFVNRMGELIPETQTDCFAWALIPNHAHLLLRTGSVPVSVFRKPVSLSREVSASWATVILRRNTI